MSKVVISFWNGSKTKEAWNPESPEFINGWKPESHKIIADSVQVIYAQEMIVYDGDTLTYYEFDPYDNSFIVVDGVYYGDFTIIAYDDSEV